MDEVHHIGHAVRRALALHGVDQAAAVLVGVDHGGQQRVGRHILLHEDVRQSALLKGAGVEDLVAAAGLLGIGDQQRGLFERQNFAQRVGAGAGDQHVGAGVGVAHILVEIFVLMIALCALAFRVQIALAAQMDDLEAFGELIERGAHGAVDRLSAAGAAHHHQHGAGVG